MKASVVILNWNGEKYLEKFLPILLQHTTQKDVEIVVADNGSTDNSQEVLKRFTTVKTIFLDKNYGFAEGYNRALKLINSTYYVLLNSDVEVTPDWLTVLLNYLDTHSNVAACQPKICSYTQRNTFEHAGACGGYIDKLGYPFCRGRFMSYVEKDEGQYNTPCDIFWATGACLCIRSSAYWSVGGLDDKFFAHMEEIDLCWRLNSRGYSIMCLPESVVYHIGGGSLSAENPFKTYLNFRNNLLLLYKNMPAKQMHKVFFIRYFMDYVAALQMLLTGKPRDFKAVFKARHDFQKMKSDFAHKRKENMAKATAPYPATIANRSIVWDYYIRGKRK